MYGSTQSSIINNIIGISLTLNCHKRINYGITEIKYLTERISDNILYLPLDTSVDRKSSDPLTYVTGINQTRIDQLIMTIEFDIPVSGVTIFSNGFNIAEKYTFVFRINNKADIVPNN